MDRVGESGKPLSVPRPSGPTSGQFTAVALLEAVLFAARETLTDQELANHLGITPADVHTLVLDFNALARHQGRPVVIEVTKDGYNLVLAPRHRGALTALYETTREVRLPDEAVETLAVISYRQPIVKADIDALQGRDSGPLLRQLLRRRLITTQAGPVGGVDDLAYVTTSRFLELFGLQSLQDLPRTTDVSPSA
jgi:segregation and condensation protein B